MIDRLLKASCLLVLYLSTITLAYSQIHNPKSSVDINAGDIMYHIMLLSSDELKGRAAGTQEGRIAAAYIANEFERFGLLPVGDSLSFFQVFEFRSGVIAGPENKLTIRMGDRGYSYQVNYDYVPISSSSERTISGDVVFVGYGVNVWETSYNDYAGIDVTDRIVLFIINDPEGKNPITAYGNDRTLYDRAVTARSNGASGVLFYYGYHSGQNDELLERQNVETFEQLGIPVLHIRRNIVEKLFEGTNIDPAALEEKIILTKKPASIALPNKTAAITTDFIENMVKTQNVVGWLPGKDPDVTDRYFIIGAHYDHLGNEGSIISILLQNDRLFNGADDNASGVAGMLELIEKFSDPAFRPNHSLLFIAFGASELGSIGAQRYVENPVYPARFTRLMVNFDAIGRMKNDSLFVNASSTFAEWFELADSINQFYNFDIIFDDTKIAGGDHIKFAGERIPILAFTTGTQQDFHQPEDEFDKINAEGTEQIVQFSFDVIDYIDRNVEFADKLAILTGGNLIESVVERGIADKAGLKAGDIIIKFMGETIKNEFDYHVMWSRVKPGDIVEIVVLRDGKRLTFTIRVPKM